MFQVSLFARREKVTDQLPGRNNGVSEPGLKHHTPRLKCMQIAVYPRCIYTRASTRNSSIYVFKSPCSSSGTFVGFSNRTVYSCISICTYRSASHMQYAEIRPRACVHTCERASISIIVVSHFRIPPFELCFTLAIVGY